MATPKPEIIFVYNAVTGAPLSGNAGSMSFDCYKDETGSAIGPPAITEIGSTGVYKFTPVFSSPGVHGIVYILNNGASAAPRRIARYMRSEDYYTDNSDVLSSTLATASGLAAVAGDVSIIKKIETGKWAVITSGPDSNRLILYDTDGTTPLYKFDLTDSSNVPTTIEPYKRTPV